MEPRQARPRRQHQDVSIRRADLGLLELGSNGACRSPRRCFNPPGGFGAFGTRYASASQQPIREFQSAGRIWGFWNVTHWAAVQVGVCFNPPGGFGAFGTWLRCRLRVPGCAFQSAGRIWGFWNRCTALGSAGNLIVSIRRADLGLLELFRRESRRCSTPRFQSAGRIWGFWNPWIREGQRGARMVSIRRADLGLLERVVASSSPTSQRVSIRRADLGLLEPTDLDWLRADLGEFQSAGRIWGFWNVTMSHHPP